MKEDQEGFWYPEVDVNQCINCGLCEKRCPILNDMKVDNQPRAYACYNKDEIIRKGSSSGGVFTLLASLVIEKRRNRIWGPLLIMKIWLNILK